MLVTLVTTKKYSDIDISLAPLKKFSDIDISVAAIIASATLSHSSRKTIFRLAVNKHIICVHTYLL
jgi:hypothetical protein